MITADYKAWLLELVTKLFLLLLLLMGVAFTSESCVLLLVGSDVGE